MTILVRAFESLIIELKMRAFILFAILLKLCSCALTEDFLAGFETGVVVRNDDRAFKDYNCPRPQANDALAKQI